MAKILFISHGHPRFSKGGAEVASWNLFCALKNEGHECLYLARNEDQVSSEGATGIIASDQVLFNSNISDWFCLSTGSSDYLFGGMAKVVSDFEPEIIHVHHYAHIGIEIFTALKRAAPNAKIIFTIHEFMAMCLHNGQMIKKYDFSLCSSASFNDCQKCFPEFSSGDFFLRKSYILDQFAHVDHFISPSQFLADRYIAWGLPKNKISVIENLLPDDLKKIDPRPLEKDQKRTSFAFFGQINPYKGLDILLDALQLLPKKVQKQITLNIHGANLEKQEPALRDKFETKLKALEDTAIMHGRYEAEELPQLMADCDWVIIPSIWWENSPVVIQEAIAVGRPLIGSNIGGMKEKIEGRAGLTFEARNPGSLAKMMQEAVEIDCFEESIKKLLKISSSKHLSAHLSLIGDLID